MLDRHDSRDFFEPFCRRGKPPITAGANLAVRMGTAPVHSFVRERRSREVEFEQPGNWSHHSTQDASAHRTPAIRMGHPKMTSKDTQLGTV